MKTTAETFNILAFRYSNFLDKILVTVKFSNGYEAERVVKTKRNGLHQITFENYINPDGNEWIDFTSDQENLLNRFLNKNIKFWAL